LGFSAGEARKKYVDLVKAQNDLNREQEKVSEITDVVIKETDKQKKAREKAAKDEIAAAKKRAAELLKIENSFQKALEKLRADAQKELASKRAKTSLAELLGMSEEDFDLVKDRLQGFVQASVDGISQILEAQAESNAARLEFLDEEIDDKEEALDRELKLNELGFASNVQGKREELAALEEQKKKAQKQAEETAKRQFALDTAVQASSLITASANVLKGFSTIPLVGQVLGIAQIAVMVAAFFAARASALSQVKAGQISLAEGGTGTKTCMVNLPPACWCFNDLYFTFLMG